MVGSGIIDLSQVKPEAWYTVKAASDIVMYTPQVIWKYIREENLRAKKQGKQYYILGQDLIDWWTEVDLSQIKPNSNYTLDKAAKIFGYTPKTLIKHIERGELKAKKVKGKYIILGKQLRAWWFSK